MAWTEEEELQDRPQAQGDPDVPCFGWQFGRTRGMLVDPPFGACPRHGCALVYTTAVLMTAQLLCPKRELAGPNVQENKHP